MFTELTYQDLLKYKNYVLIDLRTPAEYKESTIPNAINIPIFTNEEREIIGKTYKQIGVEDAKILGMDIVGKKLSKLYIEIKSVANGKQIALFCARGGLRSRVIGQTISAIGLPILKLESGYKGYRNFVNEKLIELVGEVQFITLFGKTGCGKTNILKILEEKGADVLDLEGCANHRGSLLGNIGLGSPNTQKNFENLVVNTLLNRKSNIIFTEGESKRIGNVIMPNILYDKTREGKQVLIQSDINKRVLNIKNDYLKPDLDKEEIINSLNKLLKYISKENILLYTEAIKNDKYDSVIEKLMVNYYDLNYKSKDKEFPYNYTNEDEHITADNLINDFL